MKKKNRNFTEKTINFLLNILIFIFGIILLISIYTSVQTKGLGYKYTNFFGYSIFEVETGSMADTINVGDWIIVKLTKKVKLNDIVTYESDGEYITHRIIEVYNGSYITMGDANSAKDEPIKQNQIIGKVVKIMTNFGLFREILFNSSVLITLVITILLFDFAFKKSKIKITKMNMGSINNYFPLNELVKKVNIYFEKIKEIIYGKKYINNKYKTKELDKTFLYKNFAFEVDDRFKSSIKKNEEKEDELEKTSLYRVVSADTADVGSKYKNLAQPITYDQLKAESVDGKEDELEKTSLYRVVSADTADVGSKYKSSIEPVLYTQIKTESVEDKEDELDKTSLYRVIPVDSSELDNTFLEIAKNEIKETKKNDKEKKEEITKETKQEEKNTVADNDNLTKINFELLKNKKGKNIIDTAMLIKRDELNEISNILIEKRIDKPTIKDIFVTTYIDARYYNYYDDKNIERYGKNFVSRIEKIIKDVANKLIHDYRGKDKKYNDIVNLYSNTFILIANLEHARDLVSDLKAKKEFYRKEVIKYSKDFNNLKVESLIDEIMNVQKSYIDTLEYFMKKLETNMFNLCINKLSSKKDMYGLELQHNIAFSRVYSDYIIDKTYTEGIIAEDKMTVLLTLLSIQLIKDMITFDLNKKYILYIPGSLYTKEVKFERLLKIIEDRHAQNNVIILLTIKDLLSNKQILKRVRKMGYKFALVFDNETVMEEKNKGNVYIADYIFINKKTVDISKIRSFIPEELLNNVINEDIVNKVGDFGSE
jgi:signal peptidase I